MPDSVAIKKISISSNNETNNGSNEDVSISRFGQKPMIGRVITHGMSSILLGAIVALSGCATKPIYQNNNTRSVQVNNRGVPNYYRVKSGDTVSQIANRYGLNYRQVGAINGLDSRYTIYAGQWLKLWEGGTAAPSYNNRVVSPAPNNTARYPVPTSGSGNMPQNNNTGSSNIVTGYIYPSTNQVIRNFDADTGTTGMWFTGRLGDPVVASKAGQVLYAGNGLQEYGNLIMIRHDSKYITAYAHNQTLLVKEGDNVSAGQRIATMGSSGQVNQVALEFQIRENGTPIDPRAVLGF